MTLTVSSTNFPGSVTSVAYAFILDLQACVVSSFVITKSIANFSYMITSGVFTTNDFLAVQSSLACNFPITYIDNYVLGGSIIARPSFITFDTTNRLISVNSILKAHVGVYTVTVTAQIP